MQEVNERSERDIHLQVTALQDYCKEMGEGDQYCQTDYINDEHEASPVAITQY